MNRLVALLVVLLLAPLSAQAWWNADWTARKKIVLNAPAAGITADVTAVPVLVRLSTGSFDFFAAKQDGSDLRFVAQDDKTPLKFQIERYDHLNELAVVWVQLPRLAAADAAQHIWLYYGNEKAPAAADAKGGYDASQLLVFHLSESQGPPQDASGNGVVPSKGESSPVQVGLIGGAARMAANGGLEMNLAPLQAPAGFTFSAWVRPASVDGELLAWGDLRLSLEAGMPVLALKTATARGAVALTKDGWHHVAVTAGPDYQLFLDGKPAASLTGPLQAQALLRIGAGLTGDIDEIQIASVARPASWLATQVASQAQAGTLVQVGPDERTEAGEGTSYFQATMRNVTVDGWVVVILCVVMFVIAIWVMVAKALFLGRVGRSNALFAQAFGTMSRGLAELDDDISAHAGSLDLLAQKGEDFRHSPLYRIYHVGVTELKHRFNNANGGEAGAMPSISARSMNAIRASLDAQLTREGQRLNKAMVLLTIAISGGPFLGLLGTVVGVMITFAAIAAAGDVNVNAIAPGIAAALVATVAGLGVAIPALFGYNYLMTRIKDISADMHVFVDEFVTRMAENYGG
jgi:biopolymer transport protein ExbB